MNWYAKTDGETTQALGKRIRLIRLEKRITQKMLAEQCGLNRNTVKDLENGKSVHLFSFVAILRGLDLLDRLQKLIPGINESPVLNQLSHTKKRVRLSTK